jgi:hypothetical protein
MVTFAMPNPFEVRRRNSKPSNGARKIQPYRASYIIFQQIPCRFERHLLPVPIALIRRGPGGKAGAFGLHGLADMPPERLRSDLAEIRRNTGGKFGVAIIPRLGSDKQIDVCIEEKVQIVNFFWDDIPKEWLSRLKAAGILVWKQVCSVAEAEQSLAIGVDLLIVQGSEAGGHNRAEASSLVLQLLFLRGSESIGNHDSSIVDADGVD